MSKRPVAASTDRGKRKSYEVVGYCCDIAARHELGNTDVTIWPTLKSFKKNHPYHAECGGPVKLTITYTIPA